MHDCLLRLVLARRVRCCGRPDPSLDNVPAILRSVTELAAGHTGRKRVVGNTDRVILVLVGECIIALRHGTNEDADALVGRQAANVIPHAHHLGIERERDLAAIGGKVIGDGILDDLEQLLLRRRAPDGQLVQQLHHETSKSLKGTRDAHRR